MTNPPWVSPRMERGIVLLFLAAGLVMGFALALPAIRAAVDIAGGTGAISLLTDAEVPRSAAAEGASSAPARNPSQRHRSPSRLTSR